MVGELRAAGLRAEAYVGTGKFGDQMKYADKRGAAIAVIEGGDERAKGEVTLKDLALGAELAKSVESRADWVGDAPGAGQRAARRSGRRNPRHAGRALMAAFPYYEQRRDRGAGSQADAILGVFARAAMSATNRRCCSRPTSSSTVRARKSAAAPSP